MKTATIGKDQYNIPTKFDELTLDQLAQVLTCRLYYSHIVEHYEDAVLKLKTQVLRLLVQLPTEVWIQLTTQQIWFLCQQVTWCFKAKIEKQPFKSFVVQGVEYHVLAENYADTSTIELAISTILYLSYAQSKGENKQPFYELLATIARPARQDLATFQNSPDWTGDVREPYNQILAQARAKIFEQHLPFGLAIALLHFWEHTNSTFLKRYEKLFDSDGDTPPVFKHGRGMLAMLEDVAEVQIFGNIKNVYEQNVHNVFMYLEHKKVKVEQAEKAQRDADRRNNLNND